MVSNKPPQPPDTDLRLTAILEELRRRGQRVTPQRVAIIRCFLERTDHPTADDLYRALQAEFPMLALSTVYATLELLREIGEAAEVSPATTQARFDPVPGSHCHLVCLGCDAIVDLPACPGLADSSLIAAMAAQGFRPTREMHEIYGLCARCQAAGG